MEKPVEPAACTCGLDIIPARTLAERWGISAQTLKRWRREKAFPLFRLSPGGGVYVSVSEVEAWVQKNRLSLVEHRPVAP